MSDKAADRKNKLTDDATQRADSIEDREDAQRAEDARQDKRYIAAAARMREQIQLGADVNAEAATIAFGREERAKKRTFKRDQRVLQQKREQDILTAGIGSMSAEMSARLNRNLTADEVLRIDPREARARGLQVTSQAASSADERDNRQNQLQLEALNSVAGAKFATGIE